MCSRYSWRTYLTVCWPLAVYLLLSRSRSWRRFSGLDEASLSSYGLILNLSFISKTLECLVTHQLRTYLDANCLLPSSQSGFGLKARRGETFGLKPRPEGRGSGQCYEAEAKHSACRPRLRQKFEYRGQMMPKCWLWGHVRPKFWPQSETKV